MSRNDRTADRRRRSVLSVGTAAGAAFAAALISMGTAPSASAVADDLDPFADLFGTTGFNTWTTGADTALASFNPTLAANLDSAVDAFQAVDQDPHSDLVGALVPGAFNASGAPDSFIGDLAVVHDLVLFPTGLGATLDPIIDSLLGGGMVAAPALVAAPDLDPFEDLFGSTGFNSWTTMADNALATLSPALAGALDAHVDAFLAAPDSDPFSDLVAAFDPSAFTPSGHLPDSFIGDLAVVHDLMLFPTGLGATLDPIIDALVGTLTPAPF